MIKYHYNNIFFVKIIQSGWAKWNLFTQMIIVPDATNV